MQLFTIVGRDTVGANAPRRVVTISGGSDCSINLQVEEVLNRFLKRESDIVLVEGITPFDKKLQAWLSRKGLPYIVVHDEETDPWVNQGALCSIAVSNPAKTLHLSSQADIVIRRRPDVYEIDIFGAVANDERRDHEE